ncbi:uncharacterized protein LOC131806839 [Musca domestica]|uniref:Uncharacterized protein LOC131806839 n=1 Tax=Musca domestica TaxID=7370 RepID=A0ABM3VP83_MUSDO|nr:uncharacterized protein LOC131806839 [Musca domestica]
MDLATVIEQQQAAIAELRKAIANVKKAPLERRTVEFYSKKLKEMEALWAEIDRNENKIRADPAAESHLHITNNEYQVIGEEYRAAIDNIEADIKRGKEQMPQKPLPATREGVQKQSGQFTATSSVTALVRRQRALMQSIQTLIRGNSGQAAPCQTVAAIEKLWTHVEDIHFKMFEDFDDPTLVGYDASAYVLLEEETLKFKEKISTLTQVDHSSSQQRSGGNLANQVNLPKITIPQFNGDYSKWQTFADIFGKMINEQALPQVQKMWYLKANVTGEAEKLIRHLELTEANYDIAWKTLQDRYNNKRAQVSTILERMLNLPNMSGDSRSVKDFHDSLHESLLALEGLEVRPKEWDPLLIHILTKRMDKTTHVLYEQSIVDSKELQTMDHFMKCLRSRFESLEAVNGIQKSKPSATTASTTIRRCHMCKGDHPLYYCKQFLAMTVPERQKWVARHKMCLNCFKDDHQAKTCTSGKCRKCQQKHNTLLHFSTRPQVENKSADLSVQQPPTVASANRSQSYVLLATARVAIKANNGRSYEFKAILDSGSQINLVSERLVQRLGIEPIQTSLCIEGIGGRSRTANHRVNVELKSLTSKFRTRLEAFVLPNIVPPQPSTEIDITSWPIPENIKLADPYFYQTTRIDVLLGAEFYFNLILSQELRMSKELPILKNSKLGWIASGRVQAESETVTCAVFGEDEHALEELLKMFWKQDDVCEDQKLTIAEEQCENHFNQNTTVNENGRFVVRLPFADGPEKISESLNIAASRFFALERRLSKDASLHEQYAKFMKEYEDLGHMTKIQSREVRGNHYYIPHHCVLRPNSSTTKLRVVFDASCKSSSGWSLNDILHSGPRVQGDLFGMLLRFRLPRFVFTTDIEKMYRQVLVDKRDRKYQLIVWRNTPDKELEHYMLNTLTYGTTCAPYLATRCLKRLADTNIQRYPLGAMVLQKNFYVDDCMCGSDSLTTAIEMQKQVNMLLLEAGFRLRKWCANHLKLLHGIPPEDREVDLNFDKSSTKVLGLTWIPQADRFCLKSDVNECTKVTKRKVTSDLARLFDPLGIAGPVVSAAKIFIQQLWKNKLGWDEELPAERAAYWLSFREGLKMLNDFRLPRHMFDGEKPTKIEIHTFVDASEKAYGAVVYLRAMLPDGRHIVRLLCSKSKIAPIKEITLPRLELCAAELGTKLTAKVKAELGYEDLRTIYWSDSEITLYWINSEPSALKTFVANKVKNIQGRSINTQWRHVGTKDNPADYISRGMKPDRLSGCLMWFYGPTYLHGNESLWPGPFSKNRENQSDLEFKTKSTVSAIASQSGLQDMIYGINHKGSFRRLQRIVGYVLRFSERIKGRKHGSSTDVLTPMELNQAMQLIVKTVQVADFAKEIQQLRKHGALDKSSSIHSLTPFLDDRGILRVGGRLEEATLAYDTKHPMLLPYNDPIVKLILSMIHLENSHCGSQLLLATSRQKYWIIKGKAMARNIVQNCVRCTRAKPKLYNQIMGNLPPSRVTPARPFIVSGVDYCGPLWVHYKIRGKRPHKVYIAVFVCFATKAVHLEIVTDLTTEAFIGALKRFISRRGKCQTLYSDNATNFVGAKNQLDEFNKAVFGEKGKKIIAETCSREGIDFQFIPPRAPHFGGLWEAAVKSAKQLLLRTTNSASLTHEELETVVIEIEAILNSRPLTPISDDPNDLAALTPGHFLVGEPLTAQVDPSANQWSTSLTSRWKVVSQIRHEFWKRWSTEYLNTLQERRKWSTPSPNVEPGQLVIIKEDNMPVMQWPLGRITRTYKGNDGAVRVVDVKTQNGEIKRAITRLAPLWKKEKEPLPPIETKNMDGFSTGIGTLQKLCKIAVENRSCEILSENLIQVQKQLESNTLNIFPRRIRRGALNIVGNLAHSLFGVLDSEYAEQMTVTIEKANEDKQHLLDLLKNQTSIIDSTINIIRKDEDTSQRNFGNMQVEMNLLANKVKKEEDVVKTTQSIMFLTSQLMLLSSRLKHIEDNLIDVLTDAHHGRISPLLLTPHQLLQELQTIKAHIPPSRALPVREDNVSDFFKLMKSKGRVIKNHIIFEIRLPLVDLQHFEINIIGS